jgi:hypothetical protein
MKIAPIPARRSTQPKSVFLCHLSSTSRCHGFVCFTTERLFEGPLFDVGPGSTNNPFWNEKDGRPQSEEKENGAGIDATPAAWDAFGIGKGDPVRGKAKVDFELIRPPKLIDRQARASDKSLSVVR